MVSKSLYNAILVRPGEFMVRQGSVIRSFMLSRLRESIIKTLKKRKHSFKTVNILEDTRIIIYSENISEKLLYDIVRIFGIASISPVKVLDYNLDLIIDTLSKFIEEDKPSSINLIVQGEHGYTSSVFKKILASYLVDNYGVRIDLSEPAKTYYVEVRSGKAFITDTVLKGYGGLPYGVEGCMVSLSSGGVDSALATWYALKRGVRVIIVFISMYPYWSKKAIERFYESLNYIYEWVPWDYLKVYVINEMGSFIAKNASTLPSRLRCLACKANMYRVASLISKREGCKGIVTGEAIGQVASQTANNLYVLSRLIDEPVYRPLIFKDKLEIIEEAGKLGFSNLARDVGACRLKPVKPETSASEEDLELLRKWLLETNNEVLEILDHAEVMYYR